MAKERVTPTSIAAHQARVHANMLANQARADESRNKPMSTGERIIISIVYFVGFVGLLIAALCIYVWAPMIWHSIATARTVDQVIVGLAVLWSVLAVLWHYYCLRGHDNSIPAVLFPRASDPEPRCGCRACRSNRRAAERAPYGLYYRG
jgi:hypothetical protein